MPFIGTQPEVGGYSVLDALTASATASYTLQLNSANFTPSSANQLLVSLNGVIQKPGSSFTVSGSTLTFSSALDSSDSIDFILAMGEPLLVGTPSDGTINANKLASNAVTTAKITDGNITTAKIATDAVTGAKLANDIGISTTGNIATTGSGTVTSAGLITASAGVAIGGTGSANTLDDYEEGTWTPAIVGTSNTPTYYNQVGRYTKIGRLVNIQCFLQTNVSPTYSNANTQFKISGVPFNLVAIGYTGSVGSVNSQTLGFSSGDNDQGVGVSPSGSHLTVGINADEQLIFHVTGSGETRGYVENSGTTGGFIIEAVLTYYTDA